MNATKHIVAVAKRAQQLLKQQQEIERQVEQRCVPRVRRAGAAAGQAAVSDLRLFVLAGGSRANLWRCLATALCAGGSPPPPGSPGWGSTCQRWQWTPGAASPLCWCASWTAPRATSCWCAARMARRRARSLHSWSRRWVRACRAWGALRMPGCPSMRTAAEQVGAAAVLNLAARQLFSGGKHAAQVSRAAVVHRLPGPRLELLGSGAMEWSRERDRCLNVTATKLHSLSDARLRAKSDVSKLAGNLAQSSLPVTYRCGLGLRAVVVLAGTGVALCSRRHALPHRRIVVEGTPLKA